MLLRYSCSDHMAHAAALSGTTELPYTRRHYRRAPIVEMVVEIGVDARPKPQMKLLASLGRSERAYGKRAELHDFQGQVGWSTTRGTQVSARQRPKGYAFSDAVAGRQFQARTDAFAFAKLHPYSDWESVRDEAQRLWSRYAGIVKIERIRTLGVRYVNRLDLPKPVANLKDWLLTGPDVAAGMSQTLRGFAMQLTIPQPDLKDTVVALREAVVAPAVPSVVSIVLDIDVRRRVDLSVSSDTLWAVVQELHDRENLVFERSITDRVREIID